MCPCDANSYLIHPALDVYVSISHHLIKTSYGLFDISYTCIAYIGMGSAGTAAAHDAAAPALHKMERAAIAAASHITYDPNELLTLIRDHLAASGLHSAADTLTREARLQGSGHEAREDAGGAGRPESAHPGTPTGEGLWFRV